MTCVDGSVDAHKNVLVPIWTEDGPHMAINNKLVDTNRSAFIVEKINGHYK